jgi:hypothetical protein
MVRQVSVAACATPDGWRRVAPQDDAYRPATAARRAATRCDAAALRYNRRMSTSRTAWIGLAAVVAVAVMAGLGWQMMRSRAAPAPAAAGGSPATLPAPAPAPRPEGTGTASLRWSPTAPAGGSAADDPVAGYRVYVGATPDDLRLEASIADPAATGYVVERLPKGTFYYAVTTYTRLGIESERPPPVSKTID